MELQALWTTLSYFNSRPSARGDYQGWETQKFNLISIHAPPRGATLGVMLATMYNFISIHAPPRGATNGRQQCRNCQVISIHAPPRGATVFQFNRCAKRAFQFTPLREGRPAAAAQLPGRQQFQFTPLREGRRSVRGKRRYRAKFQFTPLREGRHKGQHFISCQLGISIHAPPRGATPPLRCQVRLPAISIHAPPRGATGTPSTMIPQRGLFQFTPLREGRRGRFRRIYFYDFISIHAPPRGATKIVFSYS